MTAIRIQPDQVRTAGVAAVTCGDDLRTQAGALSGVAMPDMPAAMTAKYTAGLQSVSSSLTSLASSYGSVGEELQVRAAAAEAADAPGDTNALAAGQTLSRSVASTATIVGAGGTTTTVQLRTSSTGTVASTSTGTRLTTPDALERPAASTSAANAASASNATGAAGAPAPGATPDPHDSPHDTPVASRAVAGNAPIGGAPAAVVQQAVGSSGGDPAGAVASLHHGTVDPTAMPAGEHRAEHQGTAGTPAHVDMPHAQDSDRQHWACWMASTAAHHGLPPALPVMMALAQSGMRNMPSGESDVGFFAINPSDAYAPAGAGVARDAHPSGDWWVHHPGAQLDHVVTRLTGFGGGIRTEHLADPDALSRWASQAAPGIDPSQLSSAHTAATDLVSHCPQVHSAMVSMGGGGGSALAVAKGQLGVHEVGYNAGPQVNSYLASAGVGSGNPWCASFVTWSMQHAGHEMPGTGWASVSTWVHAAQAGQNGLHFVDPSHARPGDIVAYDWGHGTDFGSDGHIGFLDSHVVNGQFTAVEGNAGDAVTLMHRNLGEATVVFMRMGG